MTECDTEGGFAVDSLGAGVNGTGSFCRILGKPGPQSPLPLVRNPASLLWTHHDDPLSCRHVVAPLLAEPGHEFAEGFIRGFRRGGVDGKASEHSRQHSGSQGFARHDTVARGAAWLLALE